MNASKIQIGTQVRSANGTGTITKIITKSTGYVEVTYTNGKVKKEMAFNLKDEAGDALKSKPTSKPMTDEQHARFMADVHSAKLEDHFLDCQIQSGRYNSNFIK